MYMNGNLSQESNISQVMLTFLVTFLTLVGIILVIAIILYILKGVGLMRMAKRGGIKKTAGWRLSQC